MLEQGIVDYIQTLPFVKSCIFNKYFIICFKRFDLYALIAIKGTRDFEIQSKFIGPKHIFDINDPECLTKIKDTLYAHQNIKRCNRTVCK